MSNPEQELVDFYPPATMEQQFWVENSVRAAKKMSRKEILTRYRELLILLCRAENAIQKLGRELYAENKSSTK